MLGFGGDGLAKVAGIESIQNFYWAKIGFVLSKDYDSLVAVEASQRILQRIEM